MFVCRYTWIQKCPCRKFTCMPPTTIANMTQNISAWPRALCLCWRLVFRCQTSAQVAVVCSFHLSPLLSDKITSEHSWKVSMRWYRIRVTPTLVPICFLCFTVPVHTNKQWNPACQKGIHYSYNGTEIIRISWSLVSTGAWFLKYPMTNRNQLQLVCFC